MQKQGCISEQRYYIVMYHSASGLKFQSIHVFHMHVWNVGLCVQHDMERRVYCQPLSHRAVVRQVTCKTAAERNFLSDRLELKYYRLWVRMHRVYVAVVCCYSHFM